MTTDRHLPSVSKKLLHHSALFFLDNQFWALRRKDYITEIGLELCLDAVILTVDLRDFRTVISGELGLWEN